MSLKKLYLEGNNFFYIVMRAERINIDQLTVKSGSQFSLDGDQLQYNALLVLFYIKSLIDSI
jgi:hypothetical protein